MKYRMKFLPLVSLFIITIFFSCGKNEVTSLSLNKTTTYLIIGQTDSLFATITATGDINKVPQTWTSSNNSVATVDNGIVTAIGKGTATISDMSGKITTTCEVTVDDKINPDLTQGELWYFGDAYKTGESNLFTLYLGGPGIDMNTLNGNGEILMADFNVSLSVKDSIPVGTYDMMTDLSQAVNYTPFTNIPGYVENDGNPYGCWYFGVISDPVYTGNVIVSRKNDIYTIRYEFFDYYGVTISGTFQGTINYVNATTLPAQVSLKNRLKLNTTAHVNKTMKFHRR